MANPPMANATSSPPITRSANRLLVPMDCVALNIMTNSDVVLSGLSIACLPQSLACGGGALSRRHHCLAQRNFSPRQPGLGRRNGDAHIASNLFHGVSLHLSALNHQSKRLWQPADGLLQVQGPLASDVMVLGVR